MEPSSIQLPAAFVTPAARGASEPGIEVPRSELVLAIAELLALRRLAGGGGQHRPEDPLAHRREVGGAVEDLAAIDVHILRHAAIERRVGRELERGHRAAAETGAAAGGEADQIGAARHLAGRRYRVEARRIHEDEARGRDRLGIAVDLDQVAGAA